MANSKWQKCENSIRLCTPKALDDYGQLEKVVLPKGDFDCLNDWTNTYRIWAANDTTWYRVHRGYLVIKKEVLAGNAKFKLSVEKYLILSYQASYHKQSVEIICHNDRLATPVSWLLESEISDIGDGSVVNYGGYKEKAEIKEGVLVKQVNGREVRSLVADEMSGDWTLMEAAQRFTEDGIEKPFTVYEEMDKPKIGHTIKCVGREFFSMGGEEIVADIYIRMGKGSLPVYYYVNIEDKRLMLMISGMQAYILDSNYTQQHQRVIDFLSKRGAQK